MSKPPTPMDTAQKFAFLRLMLLLFPVPPIGTSTSPQSRQQPKQCGLPPNMNELPDFAQDEIRAVWKDYVPGKKCDKELLITEDILAVLAMFDKELERQGMKTLPPAGKGGVGTTTPTTTEVPTAATSGEDEDDEGQQEKEVEAETPADLISSTFPPTAAALVLTTHRPPQHLASSNNNINNHPQTVPPPPVVVVVTPFGPPTVPKGLRQIGAVPNVGVNGQTPRDLVRPSKTPSPHDFDEYEQQQQTDEPPVEEPRRLIKQRILNEYEAEENGQGPEAAERDEEEEREPGQLYEQAASLPFLRGANPAVVRVFRQVLQDPTIPSEQRRMEEVHLLAVSYLNTRQLAKFNAWSTERRKKIHLREHHLHLSRTAREALQRLARAGDERQRKSALKAMPKQVKGELHSFALMRKKLADEQK